MHVVVALLAFGYAVASTFGAWSVVRRRKRLAAAFMASAALLTVSGVAALYRLSDTWWLLATGSTLASLAGVANAAFVLRRVQPAVHVARALFGAGVVAAAWWVGTRS